MAHKSNAVTKQADELEINSEELKSAKIIDKQRYKENAERLQANLKITAKDKNLKDEESALFSTKDNIKPIKDLKDKTVSSSHQADFKNPDSSPSSDPQQPLSHQEKSNNLGVESQFINSSQQQSSKAQTSQKADFLRALEGKKMQTLLSKSGMGGNKITSPVKLNLVQAESLKMAQERINHLESELEVSHEECATLVSVSQILKEKIDDLTASQEESVRQAERLESDFQDEKATLLDVLKDSKKEVKKLQEQKGDLENRFSQDVQGSRFRELSLLESQIDILKSESALLKKEKDNKIISLEAKVKTLNYRLDRSRQKTQEMQIQVNKLKKNSHKIVSILRNTVNNLDGFEPQTSETTDDFSSESDQS